MKLNDALGGLLTYKLAGEDALRGSGLPAVVVRPCALTEEPAGAPLEIDQGDVIKVGACLRVSGLQAAVTPPPPPPCTILGPCVHALVVELFFAWESPRILNLTK